MARIIVCLGICVLLAGCAAQPSTPTATAAAPIAASASAKPTTPPGFKARLRNGETVYCRTVESTGSMFPREECFTEAALEQVRAQQKRAAERLLNKPVGCRGEGCVSGQ